MREGTEKPNVTEIGPWSYREVGKQATLLPCLKQSILYISSHSYQILTILCVEVREKQNIVPVLETISYGSYIAYVFDPATSCDQCDANRTVTVINPVIVIFDWAVDKVGGGRDIMRG